MTEPPVLPPLPPPGARLPLRKSGRSGGWVSFIAHVLFLLLVVEISRQGFWWETMEPEFTNQLKAGGGGGQETSMVYLQPAAAPKAATVVKTPPVTPPVPVVTPTVVPPPEPQPAPVDTMPKQVQTGGTGGTGGGTGGGAGTGTGPGTGPGAGPGTGGTGPTDSTRSAARDPEPRQLILIPFDFPPSMRGLTIAVTFFVTANGRVDRVLCSEDIPDRGYAKRFEAAMRAYLFRPARSAAGLPVSGATTISIKF